jgi:hypothetical protein
VIQPSPDDAEHQAEEQSVPHVIRILATPLSLQIGYVSGDQDRRYDDDAIPVYSNRA